MSDPYSLKRFTDAQDTGLYGQALAELRQAIAELEAPAPVVINAYAKFAGDNSAMERAAKAREKAGFLRALLSEIDRQ